MTESGKVSALTRRFGHVTSQLREEIENREAVVRPLLTPLTPPPHAPKTRPAYVYGHEESMKAKGYSFERGGQLTQNKLALFNAYKMAQEIHTPIFMNCDFKISSHISSKSEGKELEGKELEGKELEGKELEIFRVVDFIEMIIRTQAIYRRDLKTTTFVEKTTIHSQ